MALVERGLGRLLRKGGKGQQAGPCAQPQTQPSTQFALASQFCSPQPCTNMTDSTRKIPHKSTVTAAASPASSSIDPAEVSSVPTSPDQPHKASDKHKPEAEADPTTALAPKAAEVVAGWTAAHDWFFGEVVGTFHRHAAKADWIGLGWGLGSLQEKVCKQLERIFEPDRLRAEYGVFLGYLVRAQLGGARGAGGPPRARLGWSAGVRFLEN